MTGKPRIGILGLGTMGGPMARRLASSGFAVTGLADSANLVAFYDRNGFQARIAANWRDAARWNRQSSG